MTLRFSSPEETLRAMELAKRPYRPPEIIEQQRRIEEETRTLELRECAGEPVTAEDIQRIVGMKLELDRLYTLWIKGKLGSGSSAS